MFGFRYIVFPAVLVATVAGYVWGALWYSPVLFGRQWQEAMGRRRGYHTIHPLSIGLNILTTFVTALSLGFLIVANGARTPVAGTGIGLFVGLGFIATNMLSDYYFHGWQKQLFLVDVWYRVTLYGIMGAILGAWM